MLHLATVAAGLFCLSCSTPPITPVPKIFPREVVEGDIQDLGARATDEVARGFRALDRPGLRVFSGNLVKRLSVQDPLLNVAMPEVQILQEVKPALRVIGLPGTRLFIPAELLKAVQYEAEYAAALAIELAHLSLRHYARQEPASQEVESVALPASQIFGVGGVLTYSDEQNLAAAARATQLLYGAGYDPRGLLSYLSTLERQDAKSPFDAVLCARMMEKVRETLSQLSPLLNPTLQTSEFRRLKQDGDGVTSARKRKRRGRP